jgi:hypothetical protein
MPAELGIIITNRDRPQPLSHCLQSLAVQTAPPAWVAIADLGSSQRAAAELEALAERFGVSYLHIAHDGPWNQALAFNTALRHMPAVAHVVQLDADMMLHPYLLAFTQRGLQTVEALCCVPSYVSAHLVPKDYDGSWSKFRQVLSVAYGGNKLSRGGYAVFPRDWLMANGGYDEAYCGWGFEDADLWWRAGQQLTTYVEESGSLLLHQSHIRQSGATGLETNPNWRRYQLRELGISLPVNPGGFGQAPIHRTSIRLGICSRNGPRRSELTMGLRGVRVRTREQKRLRPAQDAPTSPITNARSLIPDEPVPCSRTHRRTIDDNSANAVSIILLLNHTPPQLLAASLESLTAQTVQPNQIILSDCRESPEPTQKYLQCALLRPQCDYISTSRHRTPPGKALDEAMRFVHPMSLHMLAISEGIVFHPRMLELLVLLQENGPRFVHGRTHAVPAMACELSAVAGFPWEAWGSVAHLEGRDLGWWHFGRKDWIQHNALYDEHSCFENFHRETIRRVQRLGTMPMVQLPNDWVLCYSCPRRGEIPGEVI